MIIFSELTLGNMLTRSRSRSRGRKSGATVASPNKSPGRRGKKKEETETKLTNGPTSPGKERRMTFKIGDMALARWPGSKLYYNGKVITFVIS